MLWVNIDKPLKKFTIHEALSCIYVAKIQESPYKGVECLKRDGGWMSFQSKAEAMHYYDENFNQYQIIEHC